MMSGTSLDGIDVAAIETDGETVFQQLPGKMYPYTSAFQNRLKNVLGSTTKTDTSQDLEKKLTMLHAEAYLDYVKKIPHSIHVVGFHGHTITHQPPSRYKAPFTWQLGDGIALARMIDTPVVYDLRQNDIQHSGEGAPLVPVYQKALANNLEQPLAIINIGGISNVAYIAKDALIAFDMGPGNALIDQWMHQHTDTSFDTNGETAAQGHVDQDVVTQFSQHSFFQQRPPKSLDRLDYTLDSVKHLSVADGAATLVEMTAVGIQKGVALFPDTPKQCLITGGGRLNKTLMGRLQQLLAPIPVHTTESVGWSGDFLEAEAWAYLAVRSMQKKPITFPTTTGVTHPLSGGKVADPRQ
jgi:anhydro-N-acetylmuramic acid kinase